MVICLLCFTDSNSNLVAAGKLSRPASAKSGKSSRPASGKVSRPQSGKRSRPASGKLSTAEPARATPELRSSPVLGNEENTDLTVEIDDTKVPQIVDKNAESAIDQDNVPLAENQSKETQPKVSEDDQNKAVSKEENVTESKIETPRGRQRALKVKKPAQQRQRPGKTASSQKTENQSVAGGYIPKEDSAKKHIPEDSVKENDKQDELKNSVPDITVEVDSSQIIDEADKGVMQGEGEVLEESHHDNALGIETDTGIHIKCVTK